MSKPYVKQEKTKRLEFFLKKNERTERVGLVKQSVVERQTK